MRLPLLSWVRLLPLLVLISCSAAPATPADPTPPPARSTTAPGTAAVVPDLRCRTDADCTVKNVGNCCGAYPACVNVDSPTDPAGVMAQCRASGRMSVCGFPAISGCQCVSGQCNARPASADTLRRPIEIQEPVR